MQKTWDVLYGKTQVKCEKAHGRVMYVVVCKLCIKYHR